MANLVGQQLGNYRLIRLLGQGAFAEVYLGEHIHLGTQVAIKVLQGKIKPEDMKNFIQEAKNIANLKHPHIVRVLEFGLDNNFPFLIMDYAPNGTLRQQHPKGSRLSIATILPYVKQIALALQHAHNHQLVHRDVKPENLLVDATNDILLSDFGIATLSRSYFQNLQDIAGTILYMAPEQLQGNARRASDQYSLGIVVYEWLSGACPFNGSAIEIVTQHLSTPPPPLRQKVPTISPAVEKVVLKALAKDPQQRFANVQEFATALEQADKPQQLPLVVPPPAIPRPHSSKVKVAGLITLALLVIFAGLAGAYTVIASYGTSQAVAHATATANTLNATNTAAIATQTDIDATETATADGLPYYPYNGTLKFSDPLSDNSKGNAWDEDSSCQFTNGAYQVSAQDQSKSFLCNSSVVLSDFAFQVQMSIMNGDCGGVVFRNDEEGNDYHFAVCQGGEYGLYLYKNRNYVKTLVTGTSSEILPGLNQSNLIAIIANGNSIDLYVNYQKIDSANDSTYSQGYIGLLASADNNPTKVEYSNAKAWTLS